MTPRIDPKLQAHLSAAQQADFIQKQAQLQNQQRAEQYQIMIEMFVRDTAKQIYVAHVSNPRVDDEDTQRQRAKEAREAALVLAEELGMIKIQEKKEQDDGSEVL